MNAKQYSEALVRKDRRIAELEGENERLRRVIGAAVEDSANLEAENANFESGARCDRDEIEGLKAERDALRHARLPCREAEVAQRRYEQAEAELAAVGSDLQDEAEYNITLRERAEQAEAALAQRDGMLRMAEELTLKVLPTFSPTTAKLIRQVFADLRARAEEGSGA